MEKDSREYQRVIDYIKSLINTGDLTAGSKLPTERAIAETLSISRNSTREALRMLEKMGVIESRRGSGNYISGHMSKSIAEMIDMMLLLRKTNRTEICAFRRSMEKAVCISIIETGENAALIRESEETISSFPRIPIEEQIEADRNFHYKLIHATNNQFWIFFMESIAEVYRRWIDSALRNADENTKKSLHEAHLSMLTALKNGDRKACEAAIDRHYDLIDTELDK